MAKLDDVGALAFTAVRSLRVATWLLVSGCSELVTLGQAPGGAGGVAGSGPAGMGGTAAGAPPMAGSGGGVAGQSGQGGAAEAGKGGSEAGSAGNPVAGAAGGPPTGPRFTGVTRLVALGSDDKEENPTFTADLKTVYFSTEREDGESSNIWSARRDDPEGIFGNLQRVDAVTTTETDTSPAISADGLTLWVGQARAGGFGKHDIWRVTRDSVDGPWSLPENVTELNSAFDDIPRPTSLGNTVMPLGSRRDGQYLTYLAVRESPEQEFGAPQLIDEIEPPNGGNLIDGFLSSDGSMLFFSSATAADNSDLYVAMRKPGNALEFEAPMPLTDLNTEQWDERDPFLSEDGTRFFFVSNMLDGDYEIYEARVVR